MKNISHRYFPPFPASKIQIIAALFFLYIFINTNSCSLLQKLGEKSSPGFDRHGGMLQDSSFETKDSWKISAPPGYGEYASLDLDRNIKHVGRQSAHIFIRRHPRNANLNILHAWTQEAGVARAGSRVRFGGWVRTEAGTMIKLSLKCEFEKPINGKRYVTIFADQPTKFGSFQYIEKTIVLPENGATALTVHAGLSAIGEVWFDDLFVKVLKK
ncbi:MAG: hypothetical protein ACE5I1_00300 [bacterium]